MDKLCLSCPIELFALPKMALSCHQVPEIAGRAWGIPLALLVR